MGTSTRVSVTHYDQLIDEGFFDREPPVRVELIQGEIVEMSPINPPHESIVDRLMYWSFDVTDRKHILVRGQQSLGLLSLDSVPQPDIAWVRQRSYREQRPLAEDVLLLIEVADSSLRLDLGVKAALYAQAGIADYWVVDVNSETVHVHRKPNASGYASVEMISKPGLVRPLEIPFAFPI